MQTKIINGASFASDIKEELKVKIKALKESHKIVPNLAIIRVGEDPGSISYISAKVKAGEEVGIESKLTVFKEDTKEEEILSKISELNNDKNVHGILVQIPLPKHIKENKILDAIDPKKDVDGLGTFNLGRLLSGQEGFIPCTPLAVRELLSRSGNNPDGKHVVICGRSNLVGRPLYLLLSRKEDRANATVTLVHSGTKNLSEITKLADILIVAVGKPNFITSEMIKDGVVVIDVGINQIGTTPEGKRILVGDVDFKGVEAKAKAITPVPGGVGPMTVAMLLSNTLKATSLSC